MRCSFWVNVSSVRSLYHTTPPPSSWPQHHHYQQHTEQRPRIFPLSLHPPSAPNLSPLGA